MQKIVILADSICGGFGQRSKKSFVHYAISAFNYGLFDISKSGMCSEIALKKVQNENTIDEIRPIDLVVISIGNVDAKPVYVNNNFWSNFVPSRYRKEKIDPRPYYSSRPLKRLFELTDNTVRSLCRRYCYVTGNYQRKVSQAEFEQNFAEIVDIFYKKTKNVVVIFPSKIDDCLFHGASKDFEQVRSFMSDFCRENNIGTFDFTAFVNESDYLLDRFHLNENGHQKVISHFSLYIKSILN